MLILLIKPKQVYVQHQKHTFSYSILGYKANWFKNQFSIKKIKK